MEKLVTIEGKEALTTSLKVAKTFGKLHSHVLEGIVSLECSSKFRESNFRLSSDDQRNRLDTSKTLMKWRKT